MIEREPIIFALEAIQECNKMMKETLEVWEDDYHRSIYERDPMPKIVISGWAVLDNNCVLWLFPGLSNKPEKVNGEWVGNYPIPLDNIIAPSRLKNEPEFIILKND